LGARGCLAGEARFSYLRKADDAILGGVDGEVAAHERTWTGNLRATSLSNQHFASADNLATKALHAEACAGVVVDVLT